MKRTETDHGRDTERLKKKTKAKTVPEDSETVRLAESEKPPAATAMETRAQASGSRTAEEIDDDLLEKKRAYNRRNAARARQRVKEQIGDLSEKVGIYEKKCSDLESQNSSLQAQIERLTEENKKYRETNEKLSAALEVGGGRQSSLGLTGDGHGAHGQLAGPLSSRATMNSAIAASSTMTTRLLDGWMNQQRQMTVQGYQLSQQQQHPPQQQRQHQQAQQPLELLQSLSRVLLPFQYQGLGQLGAPTTLAAARSQLLGGVQSDHAANLSSGEQERNQQQQQALTLELLAAAASSSPSSLPSTAPTALPSAPSAGQNSQQQERIGLDPTIQLIYQLLSRPPTDRGGQS